MDELFLADFQIMPWHSQQQMDSNRAETHVDYS